MSKPRPVSVDELSLDELRGLVGELLTRLSEVEAENAALKEEIARLKGHKGRPKLKPSGMAQAADLGKRKAHMRRGEVKRFVPEGESAF